MLCLSLFLSLFAFESFYRVLEHDVIIEIVDFENTDSEQDSKEKEKESDKLASFQTVLRSALTANSEFEILLLSRRVDEIQEVVSPPPEA